MDAIFLPHTPEVRRAVSGLTLEEQQVRDLLIKMGLAAAALLENSETEETPSEKES